MNTVPTTSNSAPDDRHPGDVGPPRVLRPAFWLVLVAALCGNAVASFAGAAFVAHVLCATISITCVVALTVRPWRAHRSRTRASC